MNKKYFFLLMSIIMVSLLWGVGVKSGQAAVASASKPPPAGTASMTKSTAPVVLLNKKAVSFDVLPVIEDGRTLVPMRAIFESLGAQIVWDNSNQVVTATLGDTMMQLKIGSLRPVVNGREKNLDVPAKIVQGRTLVPLRFVGEVFGGQVNWDASTNTINIDTPQPVDSDLSALTVEGDYINLRSGPGTEYDQVGTALRGTRFTALLKLGDWYQVEWHGKQVWVAGWLVKSLWSSSSGSTGQGSEQASQETNQPSIQQPLARQVSLEYRHDPDGIRLIMQCGSKPDVKVHKKGNITTYRYPGFSLMEEKSPGESTAAGAISIEVDQEGNDLVVEISLPDGFESERSEELEGKKQVFFIPNCIVAVDRQTLDMGGERLVVTTLVPFSYTESLAGKTVTVKMAGVRKGVARSSYEFSSSTLSKLAFNEAASRQIDMVVTTRKDVKFDIGQQGDNKSLFILLMNRSDLPEPGTVVVLDPGHGGSEPGSSGQILVEKDVNLQVALKVGDLLKKKGIQVSYTHSDDTYRGLSERPALARLLNAALFVSIHCNSFGDSSVNGTETYYYTASEDDNKSEEEHIANLIQSKLVAALGLPDRGVKKHEWAVLTRCEMPAILTEIAFLSNPAQEQLLKEQSYRDKVAGAIAEAIAEYMI